MNILSKLLGKKQNTADNGWRVGGMEDFMTLIRVYYQAVMAANLGITNLSACPTYAYSSKRFTCRLSITN